MLWTSQLPQLVKEPASQCKRRKSRRFNPWFKKIVWRRVWKPTLVFLPEGPLDRGPWCATVHGATVGQTRLKRRSVHTCTQLPKESIFFFCLQNIKGLHLFSQGSLLILWYLNQSLIKLKLCPRPTWMKACIFCRMGNFTSLQSICIWFALYCWPHGSVQQRSWCLVWGSTHQHNRKLLNGN